MVIADFNVVRIAFGKAETDAPLVVDGNRVLPLAVALQCVQTVAWRGPKIFIDDARWTYSSFRTARRTTSEGNQRAVPFTNKSAVCLSANVLIISLNVTRHVTLVTRGRAQVGHATWRVLVGLSPER
jgi:hypothetical protein